MKNIFKSVLAAALAASIITSAAASASPAIEAAKDRCLIGEQSDGYIGVIDESAVDESLRREIGSVNQQRKAAYANLASRNGVTIEQAAALTAEKLINSAPSGHCVQTPEGGWLKQP